MRGHAVHVVTSFSASLSSPLRLRVKKRGYALPQSRSPRSSRSVRISNADKQVLRSLRSPQDDVESGVSCAIFHAPFCRTSVAWYLKSDVTVSSLPFGLIRK